MKSKTEQQSIAAAVREHIAKLQDMRAQLVSSRNECLAEIERLYEAPVSSDDALQFCMDYIDMQANAYPVESGGISGVLDRVAWPRRYHVPPGGVAGLTKGAPLNLRDIEAGLSGDHSTRNNHFADGLHFFPLEEVPSRAGKAFCFFFGDIIKDKLRGQFERLYPRAASVGADTEPQSVAERKKRIAQLIGEAANLQAEIAKVDAELADISAGATSRRASGARDETPCEAQSVDEYERDYAIYRDFNGSNAEQLAQRHGVTAAKVIHIGSQSGPPVR